MIKITLSSLGQDKIKTYLIEESDIALQMINVFIYFLDQKLGPYCPQLLSLINHIIDNS